MTTHTNSSPSEFLAAAHQGGWAVQVRNLQARPNGQPDPQSWIVEIVRTFTPGDRAAYVDADVAAYGVLCYVPRTSAGCTWGTTSDGVGGHAGMVGGYYRLAKSGVSATFAKALAKLV